MKKLKLSKSKGSDKNQQKISNFFAVGKEISVNTASSSDRQSKISSYFSAPKQLLSLHPESSTGEIDIEILQIKDNFVKTPICAKEQINKHETINTSEVAVETNKEILNNFALTHKNTEEIKPSLEKTNEITKRTGTINTPLQIGSVEVKKNESSRSPGENLCVKCLQNSPKSEQNSCNYCNSSDNKAIQFKNCDQLQCKDRSNIISNSLLVSNVDKSPDLIPATPPTVTKGKKSNKISEKPVKRKFNFDESHKLKKKCLPHMERSVGLECSKSNCKESSSKYQSPLSREKENIQISKNQHTLENIPSLSSDQKSSGVFYSKNIERNESKNDILKVPTSGQTETNNEYVHEIGKQPSQKCESNYNVAVDSLPSQEKGKILIKNAEKPIVSNTNQGHDLQSNLLSIPKENKHTDNKSTSKVNCGIPTNDILDVAENKSCAFDVEDINISFLEDLSFDESTSKEPIRLDDGKRCDVTAVEHLEGCRETVLTLHPCDSLSGETAVCVLRGSWATTVVKESDVVSVTATQMSGQPGCWVVDDDAGMLTIHPDTLVSGTTIVGSLFCMRRSVLSDMYRGMDSDSSIMVVGSFLHQLLQEVLKRKVSSLEEINRVLSEFISSRHFIFSLYSSGMSLEKTKETLIEFVPKIHAFVQKYIGESCAVGQSNAWNDGESWRGTITDVADIEENIWTPRLGIKGKVDVTVKTHERTTKKVMPLELKTGRASFSAEHRGQVILYTMMMSELGQTVDSGLLLYLREGVMKEIPVGLAERRDLMMLRNQLVSELRASHHVVVNDSHQVAPPSLPRPINHHSACAKCPYLTLCSAALRVDGSKELSETNPLHNLSTTSTEHLQTGHMQYVFHWTGLLRLEHTESQLHSPALRDIWTLPPAVRSKRGTCVPEVRLAGAVLEVAAGSYEHVFAWSSDSLGCPLAEGDYVIVSSQSRPAIAAGPVRHRADCQLTLHLERDLSIRQSEDQIWHLDKYESQTGLVFNMTNLGCLLDNTEQAGRLRKAVIDLDIPQFSPKLSSRVLKASVDLMAPLNDQQKKAIFRTLAAEHYMLIKGMPGTGKTATVVALVRLAVRLKLSVLITSHTHSAVDNVLLKLRGLVDFLRLGAGHKLHPELAKYGETGRVFSSPEEIQAFYDSKPVVAVTCLGSSHPLLTRRQFDLCIVDEATQVLQPTILRPLFSTRKFILIGDPDQLPPLVRSLKAKELGLGQSLFARLDRPAVTSELSLQYRMNQRITDLANTLTYGGKLQCGSPAVATATLALPNPLVGQPEWVVRALADSVGQAVVVLDTGDTEAVDCTNLAEANIVDKIIAALSQGGLAMERVGVIAPYRAQVDLLRKHTANMSHVEVNTVDQYQGRDKDVILYSCTRSKKPTGSDILGDKNRLTVAITRARHKLIIIGNISLLRNYKLFNALFSFVSNDCIFSVS